MMKALLFIILILTAALSFWIHFRKPGLPSSGGPDNTAPNATRGAKGSQLQSPQGALNLPVAEHTRRNLNATQTKIPRPAALSYGEKARIVEDPELREFAMRETMRVWGPFFTREKFSREKEELLVKLLVERTLALDMRDRAGFDELIAEVLSLEELGRFTAFRDELPLKHAVTEATRLMERELGIRLETGALHNAESVVRAAPLNHDAIWRDASDALEAGRLTRADLPRLEALARERFELALQRHGANLSEVQRAALRRWFEQGPLAFNLRALANGLETRP